MPACPHPLAIPDRRSRFRGCLLAGAVGDALGAPVEFLDHAEILRRYGPSGITTFDSAYGRVGAITDDTQMTLYTAEGLLRGYVRGAHKGIVSYPGVIAGAYQRWLRTQGESGVVPAFEDGWLHAQRDLHASRAPGLTCLAALRAMQSRGDRADNDSKGCGGVMRVAPIGLFGAHWDDAAATFDLACAAAAITHGHPTGQLAAGVFAVLVHDLALGQPLAAALDRGMGLLAGRPGADETLVALSRARALAVTSTVPGVDRHAGLARLGEGWIAEEALAMSVYCALVASDLRDGLVLAVNHAGDSDSTGAITGNLLGALWGEAAIPADWRDRVELGDVIAEVADDLHDCRGWAIGDGADDPAFDAAILRKYPGV